MSPYITHMGCRKGTGTRNRDRDRTWDREDPPLSPPRGRIGNGAKRRVCAGQECGVGLPSYALILGWATEGILRSPPLRFGERRMAERVGVEPTVPLRRH